MRRVVGVVMVIAVSMGSWEVVASEPLSTVTIRGPARAVKLRGVLALVGRPDAVARVGSWQPGPTSGEREALRGIGGSRLTEWRTWSAGWQGQAVRRAAPGTWASGVALRF